MKRVQGGGNKRQNYKLSRYACYMTALCCDGRKIQVAEAKKYFALKTRQAEVLIPQQNERIRELELMAEISRNERYLLDKRSRIMDVHGLPPLSC